MSVTIPTLTPTVWNAIKGQTLHTKGGWDLDGDYVYLKVENATWALDQVGKDPDPFPDPIDNHYPMNAQAWDTLKDGTLDQEENAVIVGDLLHDVLAVDDEGEKEAQMSVRD